MRNLRLLPVVCLTFVILLSSCVSKKKWTELMSDKTQIDEMLSKTQEQVKTLETDVATLSDEKAKLQEDFNNETSRLSEKIGSIESDLESTKKENEEMKSMIDTKDAEINKMAAAINSSFSPFTSKGIQLQAKGGGVYLANPVRFKSGSTRLTEESKVAMQAIVDALMANVTAKLLVEGHTDDVPMKEGASYANNQQLSQARANSVVRVLVKMGVNPTQLIAIGHGSEKPAMAYDDASDKEVAREYNRRAEFSLITNNSELLEYSQSMN